MVIGLVFAAFLSVLGLGAGYRQLITLRQLRGEPFMAPGDRTYYRRQVRRRLAISTLLVVLSGMILVYYLSGMDARMDAIADQKEGEPPPDKARADREFTQVMAIYWIAIILVLSAFAWLAVVDVWATRSYWMVRYREIKAEHETKLRRDLALYRQQKLNERAPGLKKPQETDSASDEMDME